MHSTLKICVSYWQLNLLFHIFISVYSGNFVAMEYTKHTWLSCTYNTCTRQTSCPGLYFTSSEKTRCPGEAFRIYKYTSGSIRVGNKIGIYFPRKGEWFSCWNSDCSTSSCPGTPHWYYGFLANRQKWSQCVGEVFQIFAYGKNYGDAIENGDAIILYYPYQRKWVSLHVGHHSAYKLGCPGSIRDSVLIGDVTWRFLFISHDL